VFIKHDLIPKLRELSETSSVFVITHNSTLGALLNPDRLIIAKYDTSTNKHSLMTGDFHARKVRDDTGAELPSYDDFVDAMEAGIVTYREKGEEYESLRN
jgi:ribosomal protein L33